MTVEQRDKHAEIDEENDSILIDIIKGRFKKPVSFCENIFAKLDELKCNCSNYFTMKGLIQPVTKGFKIALATLSFCKCIGKRSDRFKAQYSIRILEIEAASFVRNFHMHSATSGKNKIKKNLMNKFHGLTYI